MVPSIPDSFHKYLIFISLCLFIYSYIVANEHKEVFDEQFNLTLELNKLEYKKTLNSSRLSTLEQRIKTTENAFAQKNIQDTITKGYYASAVITKDIADIEARKDLLNHKLEEYNFNQEYSIALKGLGLIFLISGSLIWFAKDVNAMKLVKRQNISLPTYSDYCQSCSRYFDSIVVPGKLDDHNFNYNFCSWCYSNGKFNHEVDFDKFKDLLRDEMSTKMKKPYTIKKIMQQIHLVDRWKV